MGRFFTTSPCVILDSVLAVRGVVIAGILFLVTTSSVPVYADDLPASVLAEAHARERNRELLKRAPMYTCLETISRESRRPKERKSRLLDLVQLDVGVGEHQEIYSWPGEQTFSAGGLADLIGTGMVATGLFHSFAHNLFVLDGGIVNFMGQQALQGKDTLHFRYLIPSLQNKWSIDWLGATGVVGESGEFWVDAHTFTLLRLDVAAGDFPPNIPLNELTIGINYETLSNGAESTLIPSEAYIHAVETDGTEHRDAVAFSECRIFSAESKISDSPKALEKAVASYEAHREALPGGVVLRLVLDTGIRAASAKMGDALTAHLDTRVKISSSNLIIPRGAQAKGRIREFRKLTDPPDTYEVGLAFNELDWPGHIAVFFGEAVDIPQVAGLSQFYSRGTTRSIDTLAGFLTTSTTENVAPLAMPGVATFFLGGAHAIPKGVHLTWRTERAKHL